MVSAQQTGRYCALTAEQLLRIRCKDGNFRIELDPKADVRELVQKASPMLM